MGVTCPRAITNPDLSPYALQGDKWDAAFKVKHFPKRGEARASSFSPALSNLLKKKKVISYYH